MKRLIILIAIFLIGTESSDAQILDNSLFRIYRGNTFGHLTQLRLNTDQTFEVKVIEITCSLCDHEEIVTSINRRGQWDESNDTIYLESGIRFLVQNDSILHPLDFFGLDFDSLDQEQRERKDKLESQFIYSPISNFHLVYDTYQNGVARFIIDKYRHRLDEYEIEIKENGTIKELRYFWNGKRKRKLK